MVIDVGTHFTGLMQKTEGAQVKELLHATEDKDHTQLALEVKEIKHHASHHGYRLMYAAPKDHKKLGGCEAAVKLEKQFFSGLPRENWHILDIALLSKKVSRLLNSRPVCMKGESNLSLADLNGTQHISDPGRCGTQHISDSGDELSTYPLSAMEIKENVG